MKKLYYLFLLCACLSTGFAQQYIYTVAGNPNAAGPVSSFNGLAVKCPMGYLESKVVFDAQGNMYIPDNDAHIIWKVDTNGILTNYVGTGATGYNGDSIPATSATLWGPNGIAIDNAGNLYIADYSNNRVRKVDAATGLIYTIAGDGTYGYNGENIPATTAKLKDVTSVAVDNAGNVYIADMSNQRIRRVDAVTGIITSIAGTGTAGYSGDGMAATSAQINQAYGICLDAAGNLYIADRMNHAVRRVDAVSGLMSTVAGTGSPGYNGDNISAVTAQLNNPFDVATDTAGQVFIADEQNNRIRRVDLAGVITTVAGGASAPFNYNGEGGLATNAYLSNPRGVYVDDQNRIYISDTYYYRVRVCTDFNDSTAVWPGDTDNDHVVDNNDLLPLGVYFAQYGPPRSTNSNAWQGFAAPNWRLNFSGSNLKHVDCDGNGQLDDLDLTAINNNFNSTHAFVMAPDNGTRTADPDIYFVPDNSSYTAGSTVHAALWLGTASLPVPDLYGISFDIGYNSSVVQPGSLSLTYPAGLFDVPGGSALSFAKTNAVPDVAFGAVVSTTGSNVNGFGQIADLSFTTSSAIDHIDSLHLTVLAYRGIDLGFVPQHFNIIPLGTWNAVGLAQAALPDELSLYPNPTSGVFTLNYPVSVKGEKKNISVYNALGRKVLMNEAAAEMSAIDLSALPSGIYLVSVETKGKVFRTRIVKE